MKEILFRGKDSRTNKWVYGWFVPIIGESDSILVKDVRRGISENMAPFTYSYSQVKTDTIGQYIGIDDKNGTKIFEGDTLVIESTDLDTNTVNHFGGEVLYLPDRAIYVVDIEYDYFSFDIMKDATAYIYDYEVIGNMHDN